MRERKQTNYSKVDCFNLRLFLDKGFGNKKLGDLSPKERELVFPLMRPTEEQLQESEHLQKEEKFIESMVALPNTFLPTSISNQKLKDFAERRCRKEQKRI